MGQVKVVNLGKAYKNYKRRWSRLFEWLSPAGKPRHELKWILQGINFSLAPGDAVGIVGINGAGKSTLLKLITGTTRPSCGEVFVSGRVSALLELGMGFHPDFTGRQNVVMASQLMGLNAEAIRLIMPKVEEFAEIGEYIDQPVRIYSSGMRIRLAFSVATAIRPDVLIVDEALSVGDTYFKHKSFDRIRKFSQQGTTLLIVSHDKGAIQNLCDRAILLDGGRIARQGLPEEVMDFYNAMIAQRGNGMVKQLETANGKLQTTSGSRQARVEDIGLYDAQGQKTENVKVGDLVELQVRVKVYEEIDTLVMGYEIKDRLGQNVYGTNTWYSGQVLNHVRSGDEYRFGVTFSANLGVGSYSVAIALHGQDSHINANYYWQDLALVFDVVNVGKIEFVGCNWMEPRIVVENL
ncbi:ABC transporter ATP-binding protein [bacterium]|nr:ABC transporter ATP-binding protein [bacterium]